MEHYGEIKVKKDYANQPLFGKVDVQGYMKAHPTEGMFKPDFFVGIKEIEKRIKGGKNGLY
jgi:hypothetical protein